MGYINLFGFFYFNGTFSRKSPRKGNIDFTSGSDNRIIDGQVPSCTAS